MKKKLILVPPLHKLGGVSNFYKTIELLLSDNYEYVYRGRNEKNNTLRLIGDYYRYFRRQSDNVDTIIINTSLGRGGYFRDSIYFLLTYKKRKKIILYHGWSKSFEKKINESWRLRIWFRFTFLKADLIMVLSTDFKNKLIEWGFNGKVVLYTTLVDDQLVIDYDPLQKDFSKINILFLSRVEENKGIFEAIKSVELLSIDHKNLVFQIAGDGKATPKVKQLIEDSRNKEMFKLLGYVRDDCKIEAFKNSNLYIFPSNHGEGMPISILEAMAFGLPVLTTRIGGIPDFFEEGKMGLFLESRDPMHIAEKIKYLLERPKLMKEMSEYNYNYAKEHFYASKVTKRLEKIIDNAITKKS